MAQKDAKLDDSELKRPLQPHSHGLDPAVLEQWLDAKHFPACAPPWDDREHVLRLRVLRQVLNEFLTWLRTSCTFSNATAAQPKRAELVQLAVLEGAWERIAAWELLVNAGLAVSSDTGELSAAVDEALDRGDNLSWELPVLGMGTLFTPAWWVNTAKSKLDSDIPAVLDVVRLRSDTVPIWFAGTGTVPNGLVGQEISQDLPWAQDLLKRYAPVRHAYRHWFLQFRECHTHGLRIRHRWRLSKPIAWLMTLDAALERGTMSWAQLCHVPGALVLHADMSANIPVNITGDGLVLYPKQQPSVWIEGDEEAPDCLRVTLTPEPSTGQAVQIIRLPRDALEAWWTLQRPPEQPLWRPLARRLAQILARQAVVDGEREVWHNGGPVVAMSRPNSNDPLPLRLPPFTAEDLNAIEQEWRHLPKDMAHWVVALDKSLKLWLFPMGWDAVAGELHVRFPSVWPATPSGRGEIHTQNDLADEIALNALGDAARPQGWQLRVQAWRPDSAFPAATAQVGDLWGLIDINGRLVLPLDFVYVGPVQSLLGRLSKTTCAPMPAGRTKPWQWVEVLTADQPPVDAHGRKVCDVIEIWSGQRVNPLGIKAVLGSLNWGYFIACHDSTTESSTNHLGAEVGLMLCTQTQPGPLRWAWVDAGNAVCASMAPARCAVNGLYGYVGTLGQTVMEPCFESAGSLDSGLAQVRLTLAEAQAQDLVLTLPDGQQCGPEGVLVVSNTARADELPTWRWLLSPRWRNVGGEYDGHFSVQDASGAWAMVTPDGQAVTPFAACEPDNGKGDYGHRQAKHQFETLQPRRFMAWLLEAAQAGSLACMQGRLHSSYGAYDYGASPSMNLTVQTTRDVVALVMKYGPTRNEEVEFSQGTQFVWNPALRNYAGFVDLRTHAVVGEVADQGQDIRIPWDALALVVNPNSTDTTADVAVTAEESRYMDTLNTPKHNSAMHHLLRALDGFTDWLESHPIDPTSASVSRWQVNDVRNCCEKFAKHLHRLEVFLTLRDRKSVRTNAQWLQSEITFMDLPSLFTKRRYLSKSAAGRLGQEPPLWIGEDGDGAIEKDHPWVQEMLPQWDALLHTYREWEHQFSMAQVELY